MIKLRRKSHNLSQKSLFWTSKQPFAARSFVASYNVCPVAIPELFARISFWQLIHYRRFLGHLYKFISKPRFFCQPKWFEREKKERIRLIRYLSVWSSDRRLCLKILTSRKNEMWHVKNECECFIEVSRHRETDASIYYLKVHMTTRWTNRHGLMLFLFEDLMNVAEKLQFIDPMFRHSYLVPSSGMI